MAKLFFSRDISWLSFNHRILQEAENKNNSLCHRLRFIGIFTNNLDEFLKTRIAKLENFNSNGNESLHQKVLTKIYKIIDKHILILEKIWNEIQRELGENNIFIKNHQNIDSTEKEFIKQYFKNIIEKLPPIYLDTDNNDLFLKDNQLYLGIILTNKEDKRYVTLEIPLSDEKRFFLFPSDKSKNIIFFEEIVRFFLPEIFPNTEKIESFSFKITKKQKLYKQSKLPYLMSFDKNMSLDLLDLISDKIGLSDKDIFFPNLEIQNLRDLENLSKTLFLNTKKVVLDFYEKDKSIISFLQEKDILLITPYESFNPVLQLLKEASTDPEILSIKICIYRLAPQSVIIDYLIKATENGKKVTAIIELNAKADELNNLNWANKLKNAGVKVRTNRFHKKIHAKFCIIKGKNKKISVINTGNFNEETAKIYSDVILITSNKDIFYGLNLLFNSLKNSNKGTKTIEKVSHLPLMMVSPINMREKIITKIDNEIYEANAGRKSHIILKANAISDKKIIKKLYEAANAGVKIEMIIRGIYCIINQENFKYKIQAISIIDEYLEHSRIMYFYNQGSEDIYISSADWMKKNMEQRVELAVEIKSYDLKKKIKSILHIYLKDNIKARILEYPFKNHFVQNDKPLIRSQEEIFRYLKTQKNKQNELHQR